MTTFLCLQCRSLPMRKEKNELLMNVFYVPSFFCLHISDWVQWVLCLISMLHTMMLLLCLQSCYLLMWRERKRVICWWMSFVCLPSFVFTSQIEFRKRCVWFQCFTQWRHSCVSNVVPCRWERKRMNCWWMSFMCLLSFVFTFQIESSECCVWFQCFTQWCCSCVSNLVTCLCEEKGKEWLVDGCLLRVFFCLYHSDWVSWVLCLISVIHSMMLLLCL